MMDEHEVLMEYYGKATQPVGAPDPMGFKIIPPPGYTMEFIELTVGPDAYGAGKDISGQFFSSAPYGHIKIFTVSLDGQQYQAIAHKVLSDDNAPTQDSEGVPLGYKLSGNQQLRVQGAAIVNTKTLTLHYSAILKGAVNSFPGVTAIGAAVTLSNEVSKLV